jgi:hypothetical protein
MFNVSERPILTSIHSSLSYQWYYDFAVRMCLEVVRNLGLLSQDPVVVDLAIDSERQCSLIISDGLCSRICD